MRDARSSSSVLLGRKPAALRLARIQLQLAASASAQAHGGGPRHSDEQRVTPHRADRALRSRRCCRPRCRCPRHRSRHRHAASLAEPAPAALSPSARQVASSGASGPQLPPPTRENSRRAHPQTQPVPPPRIARAARARARRPACLPRPPASPQTTQSHRRARGRTLATWRATPSAPQRTG